MVHTSCKSTRQKPTVRPNPFETYRDPVTGKWIVVRPGDKK
jgi:hypothetical protein